ncbi:hypothetical protein pb186bvf_016665 [Paramecium bursaria]
MQHKNYSKITKQERKGIIHEVLVNNRTVQEVAREYKILPSTCKSIINTFVKEGRIGKKERRLRRLKKVTAIYTIYLNPLDPLQSTIQTDVQICEIEQPSLQSNQVKEILQTQAFEFLKRWSEQYEKDYQVKK